MTTLLTFAAFARFLGVLGGVLAAFARFMTKNDQESGQNRHKSPVKRLGRAVLWPLCHFYAVLRTFTHFDAPGLPCPTLPAPGPPCTALSSTACPVPPGVPCPEYSSLYTTLSSVYGAPRCPVCTLSVGLRCRSGALPALRAGLLDGIIYLRPE